MPSLFMLLRDETFPKGIDQQFPVVERGRNVFGPF